jgi:hypothetical protein
MQFFHDGAQVQTAVMAMEEVDDLMDAPGSKRSGVVFGRGLQQRQRQVHGRDAFERRDILLGIAAPALSVGERCALAVEQDLNEGQHKDVKGKKWENLAEFPGIVPFPLGSHNERACPRAGKFLLVVGRLVRRANRD